MSTAGTSPSAFRRLASGRVLGLVTGLRVGANTLTARAGGRAARLTVKNAPIGGPVFSGPQIKPWTCQAGAVDAKCNQPTTYQLLYLPIAGGQLQPYDPANPPADSSIARTTTQTGDDGPVHRAGGDRLHRPRPVPHRRALPARPAVDGVGTPGAVQPQARHHPRRQLRHELRDRQRTRRAQPHRARRRLRRDVPRAEQRGAQLQHHHAGRVDGDDQGAGHRSVRRAALHDRQRLLGRVARPAAGGERLPRRCTRASRRSAASRTPGRRRCSTSTTSGCWRYFQDPDEVGAGHGVGSGGHLRGARTTRTPPTPSRSPR